LFEALLANGRTVTLIPGVIELRLLEGGNSGAAFGILKNSTGLLIVLTFALVFGLLWLLFFKKFASRWLTAAAILVTAGGIGNLYDRVAYGYVTDFFHFLFVEFPVFNVADCCVTIGAVIVCAYLLLSKQEAPL
ncbi:MAG: signal peptidase II, partial [Oscillospiraceae bacterium]